MKKSPLIPVCVCGIVLQTIGVAQIAQSLELKVAAPVEPPPPVLPPVLPPAEDVVVGLPEEDVVGKNAEDVAPNVNRGRWPPCAASTSQYLTRVRWPAIHASHAQGPRGRACVHPRWLGATCTAGHAPA